MDWTGCTDTIGICLCMFVKQWKLKEKKSKICEGQDGACMEGGDQGTEKYN